jgi:plasmid stabilization system protein ParE
MAKDPPRIVEILPAAWDDLIEGLGFYEEQAPGLGSRFMDEMLAQIQRLRPFAGTHSRRLDHYFALADVWPWAIYYILEQDKMIIAAVLDCRRNPDFIQRRLRGK